MTSNPARDSECPSPPEDGVSSVSWSPVGNFLAASSWDNTVRIWEVQGHSNHDTAGVSNIKGVAMAKHAGPVLCTAWSGDGSKLFTGGCDNVAKMYSLADSSHVDIGRHDAPVRSICFSDKLNMIVTGSWDRTLRFWDGRSPNAAHSVNLGERCYAMSLKQSLLVVALPRENVVFDLTNPSTPFKRIPSILRYQTRCVACFSDGTGFAYGSVEGRVSITHIGAREKDSFAFKCHRPNSDDVYSLNDISFCDLGTFATCGSDGTTAFWDHNSKQRLNSHPRDSNPITCCALHPSGSFFAYGHGYDWSKGHAGYDPLRMKNGVRVKAVAKKDIMPKKPSSRR